MALLELERFLYIKSELNKRGIVSIKEISEELKVSEATVRRDFNKLEEDGVLVKIKGGVASAETVSLAKTASDSVELTMTEKQLLNSSNKFSVAEYAANIIKDGECVYIDGGTSLTPLLECLINRRIQIVTNSLLALKNINYAVANIFLVGGTYLPPYGMSVGPATLGLLKQFRFDRAFFGCSAVSIKEGYCFSAEVDTPAIKQAAMNVAEHSYLLINSSKLYMRGFYRWIKTEVFDAIICDEVENIEELPENFVIVSNRQNKEKASRL